MTELIAAYSIVELAERLRSKEISPVDLIEESLSVIAAYDESLRMFISVYAERARDQARVAAAEIAAGLHRGPLHGIPVAVKDNFSMAGLRTTMGSRIHADYVPEETATAVARLEDAGAIVVGKTNMHEYALGGTTDNPFYGTCRNPWDLDRSPGGSSGGSAVAVAIGAVSAALGSDTSGSIRIPAAMCGVAGLKPTYGRISRFGCFPESWTLDHVSPIARRARDLAVMLDAMSGADPLDETTLASGPTHTLARLDPDMRGLVVGIDEELFAGVSPELVAQAQRGIDALVLLGAEVRPVDIPMLRHADYALTVIDTAETTAVHDRSLRSRPDDFGADVRLLLECGALPSAVDYLHAQQVRAAVRREVARVFSTVDVLVSPTLRRGTPLIADAAYTPAPEGEPSPASHGAEPAEHGGDSAASGGARRPVEPTLSPIVPANLTGIPALSVPCGLVDGLPVGVQIMGPAGGEQVVLNAAAALEAADLLGSRRPAAYLRS